MPKSEIQKEKVSAEKSKKQAQEKPPSLSARGLKL